MNHHKKHCKRILKQYGKHIKAFENRNLEPSKEIQEFRDKYAKDRKSINPIVIATGYYRYAQQKPKEKHLIIKGLNLDNQMPLLSVMHTRYGFESRDPNKISCYDDIVKIANGEEN